jgi:uncharacterized membrane protein
MSTFTEPLDTNGPRASATEPRSSLVLTAHIVYALHAVSLCIGAWSAATVVGSFLFGWPSIIAVILNYMTRSDARGTWLESHFEWQISTFWRAVVWSIGIALVSAPLALVLVGFGVWFIGFFILGIWACVRIGRGWLRLKSGRTI